MARAYRAAIDDYYADPDHFSPERYLAELWTVPSRGYTTGFHSGRLDKSAHDYDGGTSLSDFEFAGIVRAHEGGELVLEVKNRLLSGDVLEFLPPADLDVVRLRLYEFVDGASREVRTRATAGEGRTIAIAHSWLHDQDPNTIAQRLPVGTVVRKARPLGDADRALLSEARLAAERELIDPSDLAPRKREGTRDERVAKRPPRLGAEGCCGLGCNGCLPFWQDARYAPLRARLALHGAPGKLSKSKEGAHVTRMTSPPTEQSAPNQDPPAEPRPSRSHEVPQVDDTSTVRL